MGTVMSRAKGRADGRIVQDRVRARLSASNG
jgi:Glu-tRNA(Gln) amidotransferase subunit E-like FAD-binding protein